MTLTIRSSIRGSSKGRSALLHRRRLHAADPNAVYEAFSRILFNQPPPNRPTGAKLRLDQVSYHPPGSPTPLLQDVSMELESNKMGLVFGKSGSGKTTLLQVITGLTQQTKGDVYLSDQIAPTEERLSKVGMVFQFPERHFLGHSIRSEITFGWPQNLAAFQMNIQRVQSALTSVGLTSFDVEMPTGDLSDGFKRRLALAVQLVRQPTVLLLDEPLAGLDWKARSDMVYIIENLKSKCTIVVVSHDLKEMTSLIDSAWKMSTGGKLEAIDWPT